MAICDVVKYLGSFPFVPPQYVMRPPVTEHVPLHSKSLCKNHVRLGCANNMRPLSWGGTNEKDPIFDSQGVGFSDFRKFSVSAVIWIIITVIITNDELVITTGGISWSF